MAEEIKFFGVTEDTSDTFSGALLKAWNNVGASRTKLKNIGISFPFFHVMDMEEALEINTKSLSWPVKVLISTEDGGVYSPAKYAHKSSEFRSIISEYKGQDVRFVVSRLPYVAHDSYTYFAMYIAYDGAAFQFGDAIFPIAFDSSKFFSNTGIDKNYVLRLKNPSGWYVESIIERDNSYLDEVLGSSLSDASDASFNSFRNGFIDGYNKDAGYFSSNLSQTTPQLPNFRLSNDPKQALNQGRVLGQMMAGKMAETFSSIANVSEKNKMIALSQMDKYTINQFKSFTAIHNSIVSCNKSELSSSLPGFFGANDSYSSIAQFGTNLFNFCHHNFSWMTQPVDSASVNSYSKLLDFDVDYSFDITTTIAFDHAQFRILKNSANNLQIRLQSKTMRGERKITVNGGTTYSASCWGPTAIEVSFIVDNSSAEKLSALGGLKYDLGSTAGTNQKYAKCEIVGDNLVSAQDGVVICSLDTLKDEFAAYFVN